jgi:hypothetical protein
MTAADDLVRHIVIPARAEQAGIIFETVAEAQTSVDPTKLTKAVEKFAAETRREIALGFVEATVAHLARRTTPIAWRACSQRFSFHSFFRSLSS